MERRLAILLALAIVCGLSVGITLLVGLVASSELTKIVGVLVGVAFGMFALDIYRALRDE